MTEIKNTILHMLSLGFNLERTPLLGEGKAAQSPVAGKNLVFTGKMQAGSREAMQAEARRLGANVQSAVSGSTDMLICGEKVGATKMEKASRLGVKILSEAEYHQLIGL